MKITKCNRCNLCETSNTYCQSRGSGKQPIMIIGEAMGETEERYGLPFIGDSGIMLEIMLNSIDLSTEDCMVTNLVRCRPPDNRTPLKSEILACYGYLYHEIVTFDPSLIVLLGNSPLKFFIDASASISKYRGKIFHQAILDSKLTRKNKRLRRYSDKHYYFLPLYHPSALIRNNKLSIGSPKYLTWLDLQIIKNYIKP